MAEERYKPTINLNQAPRLQTPLLYIGAAYVFLSIAGVLFIAEGQWLADGDYGNPLVIMIVHFFTLGFLSMTAMGILHQWIPVVFDVPAASARRGVLQFGVYVIGIIGFAWGLGQQQWTWLALSGTLLSLTILFWSIGVYRQLSRSNKPHDAIYRGIQGAILAFNVVWILGLFMALSFLGWWPAYRVLQVHIATALVGWMGILILTVQQKLNPMFSMSKAEGINQAMPLYWVGGGVLCAWASLWTSSVLLRMAAIAWVVALVIMLVGVIRILRQGKAPTLDGVFIGVGSAWLLLFGAAVMGFWLSPFAVILAFWGMLTLIFSYQARIVPFIIAVTVSRRLSGPVYKAFFMAQAMHSQRLPILAGVFGLVGAGVSIVGGFTREPGWERAGGVIILVLVATQLGGLGLAIAQGRANRPTTPP